MQPYQTYDLIIIGTGAGGETLAYALKDSGLKSFFLNGVIFYLKKSRTGKLKPSLKKTAINLKNSGIAKRGKLSSRVHYYVGGNTKVYGAALPRFRREDFEVLEHEGGISPSLISYDDLEPYYAQAEKLFRVHGQAGEDHRAKPIFRLSLSPVPHEPYIAELIEKLKAQGLHPFPIPWALNLSGGHVSAARPVTVFL
ncbi:MAG: hypothetical protein R2865_01795 [Deinococcales bacterium]